MDNLAYDYVDEEYTDDEPDYELIGGEKFYMATAAPFVNHISIVISLAGIFGDYIKKRGIKAIPLSEVDVYLSDEQHVRPDFCILCDLNKVSAGGERINGAPELVVEVLSKSTMNNDIGPKKAAYEEYGVREYWIVDPWSKRIEVFHLVDGKFVFKGSYMEYSDDDYDHEKLTSSIREIKVSIFEDLVVDVADVFKWYINFPTTTPDKL